MSMGMSTQTAPLSGFLAVTSASGAGGENRRASYAGIVHPDLHREVHGVAGMGQPRALDPPGRFDVNSRDEDVDLRPLRQADARREPDLTVIDDALQGQDAHGAR